MATLGGGGVLLFFMVWLTLFGGGLVSYGFGIFALVSISSSPAERFGPWWDSMRTPWILGAVVSFFVPFGGLIVGIHWLRTGRAGLRQNGIVGRPLWVGVPRPYPPFPPPGWQQPPPGWKPPAD